ncbi:MAG: tRNA (guanine(10)-N(2))-dimethyltransferase [Candidatus Bathyarchaeota archaeon]
MSNEFDFNLKEIREGLVSFSAPEIKGHPKCVSSKMPVFYNPHMELNRDFAVAFLSVFRKILGRDLWVCEPLTGCGVRGVRFAVEVKGVEKIVINDLNKRAAKLASFNVEKAGVENRVTVKNMDANMILAMHSPPGQRFDYIDIDPFGSPVPFIESGLRALHNEGVLALTATDMAPLCGVHKKACIRRYGVKPLKVEYCHELAVRALVGFTALNAARKDLSIEPLFCHSTDHYVRTYVRIRRGATKAERCLKNMGYIFHCFKCFHREFVFGLFPELKPVCKECGKVMSYSGPLWLGSILNRNFCKEIWKSIDAMSLGQKRRLSRIIERIMSEMGGSPTYYVLSVLCDFLNISTPSLTKVIEEIKEAGFKASLTHFNPQGIKTNAPKSVLVETLKNLVQPHIVSA